MEILQVEGMAYSDTLVLSVLKVLIIEMGDQVISQNLIAERSGVPLTTCQYALRRLIKAERVEAEFTPGVGYKYRIANGSSPARAGSARISRPA